MVGLETTCWLPLKLGRLISDWSCSLCDPASGHIRSMRDQASKGIETRLFSIWNDRCADEYLTAK